MSITAPHVDPSPRRQRFLRSRSAVSSRPFLLALILICSLQASVGSARSVGDPAAPPRPVSYEEMLQRLRRWDERSMLLSVSELAVSAGGRTVPVVAVTRGRPETDWRVMFVGQQHGDEIAGKEALLKLVESIAEQRRSLPDGVSLWVIPMANPDGAVSGERRNGSDADLNRDHLLLDQPETRALHELVRRVRPHVFVDCHEFTRDSADYRDRGLGEWPMIMMGATNHPLLPGALRRAALGWVERAVPRMRELGIRYRRYMVGGVPPEGELRYSTLEADDARNGIGLHGVLSFIIESGVKRSASDPDADLGRRVEAYLALLWPFLTDESTREADRAAVSGSRLMPLPEFIPTNAFWGSVLDAPLPSLGGPSVSSYPVIAGGDGTTEWVRTPHVMDTIVVKRSEPAPSAYAVPAPAAEPFAELLARHGLPYEQLEGPRTVRAETCRLLRIEPEYDEVYNRYGGRQIVRRQPAADTTLPTGSLVVELSPPWARRAVALLEPTQLYGLYGDGRYRALSDTHGRLPVLRIP